MCITNKQIIRIKDNKEVSFIMYYPNKIVTNKEYCKKTNTLY